jgi:hypothetical protein
MNVMIDQSIFFQCTTRGEGIVFLINPKNTDLAFTNLCFNDCTTGRCASIAIIQDRLDPWSPIDSISVSSCRSTNGHSALTIECQKLGGATNIKMSNFSHCAGTQGAAFFAIQSEAGTCSFSYSCLISATGNHLVQSNCGLSRFTNLIIFNDTPITFASVTGESINLKLVEIQSSVFIAKIDYLVTTDNTIRANANVRLQQCSFIDSQTPNVSGNAQFEFAVSNIFDFQTSFQQLSSLCVLPPLLSFSINPSYQSSISGISPDVVPQEKNNRKRNIGIIVGVICGVVVIAAVSIVVFYVVKKRRAPPNQRDVWEVTAPREDAGDP